MKNVWWCLTFDAVYTLKYGAFLSTLCPELSAPFDCGTSCDYQNNYMEGIVSYKNVTPSRLNPCVYFVLKINLKQRCKTHWLVWESNVRLRNPT